MRHSTEWYVQLARRLGHRGYLTLAEIRRAERDGWLQEGAAR